MMEPWNNLTLLPPPVNTILNPNLNNMQDLSRKCKNIITVLSKQSPLHKESALLSRFLYKFDQKFRNDIGYRILKKVNTALRRYLTLNLLKDIQNFADVVPNNNNDKYIPTKQMLEYLMIRIMSFGKILFRISINSKQASIYYMNRIKRGESHWMSLMPYALMSRIWTMSAVLVEHSFSWYSNLYPFLDKLQYKGMNFLPVGFSLPTSLYGWLDITNLDNYGRFEWSCKKSMKINISFIEDDETPDNILDYIKDINGEDVVNTKLTSVLCESPNESQIQELSLSEDVDQGVSISREYFQSFFNNAKNDKKDIHTPDSVTNKAALDTFLSKEENYRHEDSGLSLTKHLSFMQWQTLRTALVNLADSLSNNRKIERKFKKIWKEKCFDYL